MAVAEQDLLGDCDRCERSADCEAADEEQARHRTNRVAEHPYDVSAQPSCSATLRTRDSVEQKLQRRPKAPRPGRLVVAPRRVLHVAQAGLSSETHPAIDALHRLPRAAAAA